MSVANPDTLVEGGGPYTTLTEDKVIDWIREASQKVGVLPPLPANITNGFTLDISRHFFLSSYFLNGSRSQSKILDDVFQSIALLVDPIRRDVPFCEGWETSPLGRRDDIFIGDSGRWAPLGGDVTVKPGKIIQLNSRTINSTATESGHIAFIDFLNPPLPIELTTTISFTGHTVRFIPNCPSRAIIRVVFAATGDGLSCTIGSVQFQQKRIVIEYWLATQGNVLPQQRASCNNAATAIVHVGARSTLSRKLYDDMEDFLPLSPNEWGLTGVDLHVDGADLDTNRNDASATWDKIKISH